MKFRYLALSATALLVSACSSVSQPEKAPETQVYKWEPSTYYLQRVSHFNELPAIKGATIFLGDSISDGAEWNELLPKTAKVLNRGISGDASQGVVERLPEVIRHQPKKVFLMIGVNDLSRGETPQNVVANIQKVATKLHQESPKTKLYVQSILPVSDYYKKFEKHTNKGAEIQYVNNALKASAKEFNYTYIDLGTLFADAQGKMKNDYSNDGLHLLGRGYQTWISNIKPLLK